MDPTGLLAELKRATASRHIAIERDLDLLGHGLTPVRLPALLVGFHRFFSDWEPRAGAAVESRWPGFFGPRRKLELLERDLGFWGERAVKTVPRDGTPPNVTAVAEWPGVLGAMYMVEGSTLGGQIIAREVERRLGLSGGQGYSFFTGYGNATGQMWREFGIVLGATGEAWDGIIHAAQASFDALRDCLPGGK